MCVAFVTVRWLLHEGIVDVLSWQMKVLLDEPAYMKVS